MARRALITGITGQDGSYLTEFLLDKGYEVHGTLRRSSSFNTGRIDHIFDRLHLHHADMLDYGSLVKVLCECSPHEVYNLAAQSHVGLSFIQPGYTWDATARGCMNLLEAIREVELECRFYQASTSEMFGNQPAPQNEETPFDPQSPYAIAKLAAHHAVALHRQVYGLFACCGILFNHESPRRGETFVTRKIARAVAAIKAGKQRTLQLGNITAWRDWGYAPDYVRGMWMMLQHPKPDDYVLATGETHSVAEFVDKAFCLAGMDCIKDDYVRFDAKQLRPAEVDCLCGDAGKARRILGWEPKVRFTELVALMVDYELKAMSSCGQGSR